MMSENSMERQCEDALASLTNAGQVMGGRSWGTSHVPASDRHVKRKQSHNRRPPKSSLVRSHPTGGVERHTSSVQAERRTRVFRIFNAWTRHNRHPVT